MTEKLVAWLCLVVLVVFVVTFSGQRWRLDNNRPIITRAVRERVEGDQYDDHRSGPRAQEHWRATFRYRSASRVTRHDLCQRCRER